MKQHNYTCDTCSQGIYIAPSQNTISNFGRCTLTQNCRGILRPVKVPALYPVTDDYTWNQVGRVSTIDQKVLSNIWHITHNLNTYPVVNVFTYGSDGKTLTKVNSSVSVVYTNVNQVTITLPSAATGVTQCFVRDTRVTQESVSSIPANIVQVSYNAIVTIAVPTLMEYVLNVTDAYNVNKQIVLSLGSGIDNLSILSPWSNYATLNYNNIQYTLYELNIGSLLLQYDLSNQSTMYIDTVYNNNQLVVTPPPNFMLMMLNAGPLPNLGELVIFSNFNKSNRIKNIIMSDDFYVTTDFILNAAFTPEA